MRHLWLCVGLLGCISPSIQVQQDTGSGLIDTGDTDDTNDPIDTEDTEDTEETDTEETDTEETDTQDTDTDPPLEMLDPDYGTAFMRDQFLVINTEVSLGTSLLRSGGSIDMDQALYGFLKDDSDWGFAVSLGGFDQESAERLLTQPISLFRANGAIITLNWMPSDGELRPIIMLNRFTDESNEIRLCELTEYGSTNGATISETDLHNGYRIYVISQDFGVNSSMQMYVQYSSSGTIVLERMFGSLTGPTGECETPITDDFILLGKGGFAVSAIDSEPNDFDVPDLQGRVDDIVFFNSTGVKAFLDVGLPERKELLERMYNDITGIHCVQYQDPTDCDPDVDDGWHWYPVNPNQTLRNQGLYNELWDETHNHVDLYTFAFIDTSDGIQELSADEALEHYYIANQRWFPN